MPAAASAQTRAVVTATANARATIVAPLTLVKVQDMSFGKIVPRPTAGTVTVDQNTGQCSVTGTILEVGTCRYAQFASQGTKNMNARITLNVVSNLTGPGQTMVLDNIILGTNSTISFAGNSNANGSGVGLTQGSGNQRYTIVSNSGIFVLNIGGRLNVNANQARGIYTGSITVTVQYN
ncbi:MAG TPA: DUF4402 domain-containing protein [Novosphingobium sp.]|nr:DUF4402 domain-containing protein [Novosphingobium sp.]